MHLLLRVAEVNEQFHTPRLPYNKTHSRGGGTRRLRQRQEKSNASAREKFVLLSAAKHVLWFETHPVNDQHNNNHVIEFHLRDAAALRPIHI
jgi:hypothetical protein